MPWPWAWLADLTALHFCWTFFNLFWLFVVGCVRSVIETSTISFCSARSGSCRLPMGAITIYGALAR